MHSLAPERRCARRKRASPAGAILIVMAALAALVVACHSAPLVAFSEEEPWRLHATEHRDEKLSAELAALQDARLAEAGSVMDLMLLILLTKMIELTPFCCICGTSSCGSARKGCWERDAGEGR